MAANPSHLEAVDPVLEGIARAKLDQIGAAKGFPVLPILLHGDASFAGQGVVYETLQMSQLRPYKTGGTVHVVVNNQVGFTTSPFDSRTSVYCTDVAKAIQSPIFHINGDDAESVARIAQLAFEYREKFNKDVVLDVVCYRRRGHNEGDDPSFTQPRMYDLIEQKRSVRKLYTEALIGRGDISTEDAEAVLTRFRDGLESVFKKAREEAEEDDSYRRVPYYPPKLGKTGHHDLGRDDGQGGTGRTSHSPRVSRCIRRCCRSCSAGPTASPTARSTGRPVSCWRSVRCCWRAGRCGWWVRTPDAAPSCNASPR